MIKENCNVIHAEVGSNIDTVIIDAPVIDTKDVGERICWRLSVWQEMLCYLYLSRRLRLLSDKRVLQHRFYCGIAERISR